MCRFVIYLGAPITLADLLTRPAHSLIRQSYKAKEREEPLNGDGFGVAWYAPALSETPALFKDVTPAWNNSNLADLARVTQSGTILAHVRAATQGLSVIQTNCHPFTAGRYAFMHNGNVNGFWGLRRKFLNQLSDSAFSAIHGTTDSEHVFGLFLDRLADRDDANHDDIPDGTSNEHTLENMASALSDALQQVAALVDPPDLNEPRTTSTLNFAVTDGVRVVASRCVVGDPERANTLYIKTGHKYICRDAESGFEHDGDRHGDARDVTSDSGRSVLIASEPLFDHASWTLVPVDHLVLIDADKNITMRPWSPS